MTELNMIKMEKEFVSYDMALALKELGFNEPCFDNYNIYGKLWGLRLNKQVKIKGACLAPTFSQAFRFFREKYRLEGAIYRLNFKWASHVFNIATSTYCFKHELFETYENAEINSLLKLIEITKN